MRPPQRKPKTARQSGGESGITRRYAPRPSGAALRALSHSASLAQLPATADRQDFRYLSMAERVGFEPTNTREDVTGIPVQRLRPLGHLSNQSLVKTFSKDFRPYAHPR